MKDLFSIFIPTYNRWGVLEKTLERTLENISDGVRVVVVDNDSNPDGKERVEAVIARYPGVDCRIVKNDANLGGDGNILRCFELCKTPYLLVLGDDDFVMPGFLQKISKYLLGSSQWGCISFQVPRAYAGHVVSDREFDSPFEMVRASNNWAELIFISTTIFNKDLVLSALSVAQRYQVTCSSHVIGVLKGWERLSECVTEQSNLRFLLSADRIIESGGHAADHDNSFTQMHLYQGLPLLQGLFKKPVHNLIVQSAVRMAAKKIFKPRVLAKEIFRYTYFYGWPNAWPLVSQIRTNIFYVIGFKVFFYRYYLIVLMLIAQGLRFFKSAELKVS